MDGFAGSPKTNTAVQDALINVGFYATVFLIIPTFLISLVALIRYQRADRRALWLPAVALAGPLLLVALVLISNTFW